jgi:hypothetical protein
VVSAPLRAIVPVKGWVRVGRVQVRHRRRHARHVHPGEAVLVLARQLDAGNQVMPDLAAGPLPPMLVWCATIASSRSCDFMSLRRICGIVGSKPVPWDALAAKRGDVTIASRSFAPQRVRLRKVQSGPMSCSTITDAESVATRS